VILASRHAVSRRRRIPRTSGTRIWLPLAGCVVAHDQPLKPGELCRDPPGDYGRPRSGAPLAPDG